MALFLISLGIAVSAVAFMWAVTRLSSPPRGRPLSPDGLPDFYTTPPKPSRCRNLVKNGPTPCWHPHCDCMTADYAEPKPRLGADEVLRRHLMTTNPKRKTRVPRI